MKILLFGRGGQVGWELQRSLGVLGQVVALDFDAAANPDQLCGDFSNLNGLAETVRRVAPDVLVNAAAHTAVDKAEAEKLGLDGGEPTDAYARAVVDADFERPGDGDVIEKVQGDLAAKGIELSEAQLRVELTRAAEEARRQLTEK